MQEVSGKAGGNSTISFNNIREEEEILHFNTQSNETFEKTIKEIFGVSEPIVRALEDSHPLPKPHFTAWGSAPLRSVGAAKEFLREKGEGARSARGTGGDRNAAT